MKIQIKIKQGECFVAHDHVYSLSKRSLVWRFGNLQRTKNWVITKTPLDERKPSFEGIATESQLREFALSGFMPSSVIMRQTSPGTRAASVACKPASVRVAMANAKSEPTPKSWTEKAIENYGLKRLGSFVGVPRIPPARRSVFSQ